MREHMASVSPCVCSLIDYLDTLLWPDRVFYSSERLASIAHVAASGDDVFSLDDRIGLVHDAMALAKSGHATASSALALIDILRNEKECEFHI